MSREWTETHIRELIKRELKKINTSSGFGFTVPVCALFSGSIIYNRIAEITFTPMSDTVIRVSIYNQYPITQTGELGVCILPDHLILDDIGTTIILSTILSIIGYDSSSPYNFNWYDGMMSLSRAGTNTFYAPVETCIVTNKSGATITSDTRVWDYDIPTQSITPVI